MSIHFELGRHETPEHADARIEPHFTGASKPDVFVTEVVALANYEPGMTEDEYVSACRAEHGKYCLSLQTIARGKYVPGSDANEYLDRRSQIISDAVRAGARVLLHPEPFSKAYAKYMFHEATDQTQLDFTDSVEQFRQHYLEMTRANSQAHAAREVRLMDSLARLEKEHAGKRIVCDFGIGHKHIVELLKKRGIDATHTLVPGPDTASERLGDEEIRLAHGLSAQYDPATRELDERRATIGYLYQCGGLPGEVHKQVEKYSEAFVNGLYEHLLSHSGENIKQLMMEYSRTHKS